MNDKDANRALMAARLMHEEHQLNAQVARKSIVLVFIIGVCLIVSLILNGMFLSMLTHQKPIYFATVQGNLIPLVGTNEPSYSDADVIDFGAKALRKAFTIDFVNYHTQVSSVSPYFSQLGFKDYYQSLLSSNILSEVKNEKMNLSIMTSNGMIKQKGRLNGIYTWDIQYPVSLTFNGQNKSIPAQHFIFAIRIQRADTRVKPQGLELINIITKQMAG